MKKKQVTTPKGMMKWFYQNIDEYCLGNVIDIEWITEPHRIKYPTGFIWNCGRGQGDLYLQPQNLSPDASFAVRQIWNFCQVNSRLSTL